MASRRVKDMWRQIAALNAKAETLMEVKEELRAIDLDTYEYLPGYTCPLIDEVISQIAAAKDALAEADEDDWKDAIESAVYELDQICMEPIREANSDLRDAATDRGGRLEEAEMTIDNLMEKLA